MPVSSSAQLTLLPYLLGWPVDPDRTGFAAGLHAGSCAGLAVGLRHDLFGLDRRTAGWLALSALPAAVAGAVGQDAVERRLGRPGPTAVALAGAGLLMWLADRRPEVGGVGGPAAAVAAAAQVVALVPGISRSGATLTALRSMGVRREDAMRWSLLMSLPVTAGAAALTVRRSGSPPSALPTALAGIAAWRTHRSLPVGSSKVVCAAALYRLGLAAVVAVRVRRESR